MIWGEINNAQNEEDLKCTINLTEVNFYHLIPVHYPSPSSIIDEWIGYAWAVLCDKTRGGQQCIFDYFCPPPHDKSSTALALRLKSERSLYFVSADGESVVYFIRDMTIYFNSADGALMMRILHSDNITSRNALVKIYLNVLNCVFNQSIWFNISI